MRAISLLTALAAATLALAPAQAAGPALPTAPPPGGTVEKEERDGLPTARRVYDAAGTLLEETLYDAGEPVERRVYRRGGGRLRRMEVLDPAGALRGALDYRYDGNGRLVGLLPSGSVGGGAAGMLASGASPQAAWTAAGGRLTLRRMDARGLPLREETIVDGKTVRRASYTYAEGGGLAREEIEDIESGRAVVRDYDESARLRSKMESLPGAAPVRTDYRYDDKGRLAEERSRERGSLVVRSLSYDEEGKLAREEIRVDGIVAKIVEHRGDVDVVELYYAGALFVRTSYSGGRKLRDEFFEGGQPGRAEEYR